jgi:cell shape-determining protein MreC
MKIEERINKIIDEKEQCQLHAIRLEAENKRLKEILNKIKEVIEVITDER